uniref:Prefoldin subunit 4 n=1 Tax=Parastrongyloides trichosuri TaxID=131310 RepID=A0A0N4ZKN3_PARTI
MSASNLRVNKEDQAKINKYATGHAKSENLKKEIQKLNVYIENCKEAEEEIMIVDDETIPYKVGNAFFDLTVDEISNQLVEDIKNGDAKLAAKKEALQKVTNELEGLKKELYAKFGDAINLEAD